jgi:hypothetical protein
MKYGRYIMYKIADVALWKNEINTGTNVTNRIK